MSAQLHTSLNAGLQQFFANKPFQKTAVLQSLWSGYGEIARYGDDSGHSVIVKWIAPQQGDSHHPRGWNTSRSHARKLSSYHNERVFYQSYAKHTNQACKVPQLFAADQIGDSSWLLLEDLDALGFRVRMPAISNALIRKGLAWLAAFHAQFLQCDCADLWPIGSYWHLDTRPDEWEAMADSELKYQARAIDKKLHSSVHKTLLHGDAKIANFCFSDDLSGLAAVDFQYVGQGSGVIDVMYFLGSCLEEAELEQHAEDLLAYYFSTFADACNGVLSATQIQAVINEWQDLYCFAWADFERFLSGWSPGHYKLTGYSLSQTQLALSRLP
ncbi:phosphotransferase [Alteromonas sp. ASW11-36]|uniref:Phosphotransferase n=1 Tax=Alteromonas arenosi TaxID=3055817 RepID=A0ABT7T0S5_9ALTE|nr:phosphotransferase [Alteromonas sp. ASW11-36]MDM7861844.1 phosphotransferase [Alteromonas sp. ASW11-36]